MELKGETWPLCEILQKKHQKKLVRIWNRLNMKLREGQQMIAFLLEILSSILGRLAATSVGKRITPLIRRVRLALVLKIRSKRSKQLARVQIERVLFVRTIDAEYANSLSSLIQDSIRSELRSNSKELASKEIQVEPSSEYSEGNIRKIEEAINQHAPRLIISIGSQASTDTIRAAKDRSNNAPPILVSGLANPVGDGVVSTLEASPTRGRISGIIYDISSQDRIKLMSEILHAKSIAFITDSENSPDVTVFNSISESPEAKKSEIKFQTFFISDDLSDFEFKKLETFDFVSGWLFLHRNLSIISKLSPIPLIGGGAIDARNGAFVTIGDDEVEIARMLSTELAVPFLLGKKTLSDAPIYRPKELNPLYERKIYVNMENSRGYEPDPEKLKEIGAVIY